MNIAGAVILTFSVASIGILKAFEYRAQIAEIKNVLLMLSVMKNELTQSLAPMNKILGKIKSEFKGESQKFAGALSSSLDSLGDTEFSDLWQSAAKSSFNHLPDYCAAAFCELGTSLGRYSAEAQVSEIVKCEGIFSGKLRELEPQCAKTQKAYIGLYGGVGLIIAVILI